MAIAAQYIPPQLIKPIPIIWDCSDYLAMTGRDFFSKQSNHFINHSDNSATALTTSTDFVKNIKAFEKLFNQDDSFLFENAKKRLEDSLSELLTIGADAFSFEITLENSFFFTLQKGSYTYYIEQFIDDSESVVLTIFNENKILLNIEDSMPNLIERINNGYVDKQNLAISGTMHGVSF